MSTSKKVELRNFSLEGETPFRVAMANGEYVKQMDLDIVDFNHMGFNSTWDGLTRYWGIGWDNSSSIFTDTQEGGTSVGKKTIWRYDDWNSRTMGYSIWPLSHVVENQIRGWYGDDYPITRSSITARSNDLKVRHLTHTALAEFYDLPTPTFKITAESNQTSNLSEVISLPVNTDISYNNWANLTNAELSGAEHPITIFSKPYIPDVKMYLTSCTTPNMFAPENASGGYVILKQPSIYANIGLIDRLDQPWMGYNVMRSSWQYNSSYPQHYLRVLLYTPEWDSISNMSISWSITGGKANYFDKTSGTLSNFEPVTNSTDGTWDDYAFGYVPFHLATSNDTGVNTNFNIVANGLKFDEYSLTTRVIEVF